ncbi:MAG: TPM domain-containing protein [Bacteroidetes bacterium]|nr:TPM domain-containing protein [Bacteroidota bacterium]MCH8522918.1 TPM domain-containing protein [Balneolales bacterium]
MDIETFLTNEQEEAIASAIAEAERQTSGEIKVHIDLKCSGDALERAKTLFGEMNMHKTQFRNGVLIYVATDDHKLAVFGDEGIHSCVGDTFWQQEIDLMVSYFKKGEYQRGLTEVIAQIGEKLRTNFPFDQKGDTNELDNEVTYGSGS